MRVTDLARHSPKKCGLKTVKEDRNWPCKILPDSLSEYDCCIATSVTYVDENDDDGSVGFH